MKRIVLLLILVCPLVASAKTDSRPMLVEARRGVIFIITLR